MRRSLLAAASAAVLSLSAIAPAAARDVSCRLDFDMAGWSVLYKTASGTGRISCDNGQAMAVLEQAAGAASPWLLGERFSAADVYVGSQVDFGLAFKSIPDRPAFTRWAERLRGRDAYQRARALDDALMPPPD